MLKSCPRSAQYNKQDQQGNAAFNERNPNTTQNYPQGAQTDPKQNQDSTQGKARTCRSPER
jgi:hypothetical protein